VRDLDSIEDVAPASEELNANPPVVVPAKAGIHLSASQRRMGGSRLSPGRRLKR
jgi:hypothetical protein